MSKQYKKTQYLLKSMLKTIFPQEEFVEEYRNPQLTKSLELDFYYPQLKLAIEFQVENAKYLL